jgi:hypothetical protein
MNFKLLNLYLMIFWLFMGAALLLRHLFLPEEARMGAAREQHLDWLGYLALVLAVWNGFRWYMIRTKQRLREQAEAADREHPSPLAPKQPPQVTDPEFQFDRHDMPPPSPPNGAGH